MTLCYLTQQSEPVDGHGNLQLRQAADGRLVAATGYDQSEDGKIAAASVFGQITGLFNAPMLHFDSFVVGYRPMLQDGFPAVGRTDDIDGRRNPFRNYSRIGDRTIRCGRDRC